MRVGSLFSGIGGLDLGLERAGMTVAWQSEIDPHACRVLSKHWPNTPNLGDITTIEWSEVEPVDVICGGYPCPAFSLAARGRNTAPDLWPHMRSAIAAVRPRYVILENVAAHLRRGFAAVLGDLADLGFDAEWDVLTACSVGASHPRRRLFALAYPHGYEQPTGPLDAETPVMPTITGCGRDGWQASPHDVGADDGVPYRLDRLRALGNAVVPQVAELVGRRLMAVANPQRDDVSGRQGDA